MESIDTLLAALKETLGLNRDYQVAEALGIPQNTLYAWKNRNQYERLLQEIKEKLPEKADEIVAFKPIHYITGSNIGIVKNKQKGGETTVQMSGADESSRVDKKTMSIFLSVYQNALERNMIDELNKELWALGAKFV